MGLARPGRMVAWVWVAAGALLGVMAGGWVEMRLAWALVLLGVSGALALVRPSGLLLGAVGGGLGCLAIATTPLGPALDGPVSLHGVVVGALAGREADVRVWRVASPSGLWQPERGRVRVTFPGRPPRPGTEVVVQGRAGRLDRPVLPGAPDPVRNARRGGVRSRVVARAVAPLGGVRVREVPGDPTGLLRSLALGDRSQLSDGLTQRMRGTGTAHLLAISGLHVGVVAAVAGGALMWPLRAMAVWRPAGVPLGAAWLWGASVAVAYAWLVGAPVSAQRAALLCLLVAVGRALGREVSLLPLLSVAALGVVLADPASIGTPGFQLSFGAVLGILRWGQPLLGACPFTRRPLRALWSAVVVSFASTLGTLPAAAWWFQQVAPLSPVANVVAVPLVSFWIAPCAALAVWGPVSLAPLGGQLGTLGVALLDTCLEPLAVAPWTPAVGPTGAAVLAIALLGPRPWRALPLAILPLLLIWRPVSTQVVFLDVGQGDAALVEWRDGTRWLVDGGPPGRGVLHWLRRRGARHLDVVVASHGQSDHIGGLEPVLAELSVGALWLASGVGHEQLVDLAVARGVPVRVRPHESIHPGPGVRSAEPNDNSLVLRAAGVLFTGDLETVGEQEVSVGLEPVAVLKVPHHGSATSSTPALLDATRPVVAVVSAGRRNLFGHPSPEVVDRYARRATRLYRTDRDGTLVVRVGPDAVEVSSWRPGWGWAPWARHALGRVAEP